VEQPELRIISEPLWKSVQYRSGHGYISAAVRLLALVNGAGPGMPR
jgi:hypothetical protein